MLQDLALALRLQAVDRKIATLEAEIATLPRHISEIEKELETHTRRLEADRAALSANQRDRKKFEGDIQVQNQKISKLRDQMLGAKNNEQYKAFQNEISYAEAEVRKAEDKILDLMENSESLDKNVKNAEVHLKEEQQQVEQQKASARDRTAVNQKELQAKRGDRSSIVEQMSKSFYTEYERVRKKTKNSPIADATDGRCSACQISLRPQFFQDLRRGDQIMGCESCGRILTYNPIIDVQSEISISSQTA